MTIYKTRFPYLGYAKIFPGCWMFVALDDDRKAPVGPRYATRAELLADMQSYAEQAGWDK